MEEIIKNSQTKAEAIRRIFGFDNGTTRRKFEILISDKKYDISHFSSQPRKYKKIIKICPVCGNNFEDKENHARSKKTCSHSCSNTYFRSGINNPNHVKNIEKSEYSYRTICFFYHKKKCVVCDETKIVSVHHHDENHQNNDPSNLVPLCPTHHQYIHSRYKNEIIDIVNEYVYNFKLGRVL